MKLIYEYIHLSNNGVLKEQDINITGKYYFSFNKDLDNPTIVITDKTEYIKNFFDDEIKIVDITAIVGENGSGKTTIMDHISSKNYISFDTDNWIQNEKKIRIKIYEKNLCEKSEYIVVHNLSLLGKDVKLVFSTLDVFDYTVVPEYSENSIIYVTSNSTINMRNNYGNSEIVYYTPFDVEESLDSKIYKWFKIDNNTYIEIFTQLSHSNKSSLSLINAGKQPIN